MANITDAQVDANIAFSIMITSVTIPGNLLLLLIYFWYKNLRDLNNTAITMLGLTDLIRGCIVMTVKIHNQLIRAHELDPYLCHITAFICAFSFVFSPMMLAMISLVRFCKIFPQTFRCCQMNNKFFYFITTVLFMLAFTFSILPFLGVGDYAYSEPHGVCFADWRDVNKTYRTIFYTIVIGVAFPVLTVSYSLLYLALRKHNRAFVSKHQPNSSKRKSWISRRSVSHTDKISSMADTVDETQVNDMQIAEHFTCNNKNNLNLIEVPGTDSVSSTECKEYTQMTKSNDKNSRVAVIFKTESQVDLPDLVQKTRFSMRKAKKRQKSSSFIKNISKQEYQVTRLLIMIFIAYVICWFPAALVNVISLTHAHKIPKFWYYVIVTMVELKSALDPVIYGLGNRKYQIAIKSMIKQAKKRFLDITTSNFRCGQ